MSGALRLLRTIAASLWTWSVLAIGIVVTCPVIVAWRLVGWPFDRANYLGGRLFRLAGVLCVKLTPRWHFAVQGVVPADPRHPYVVVANHESFADMLLLCHLPWEMKWFSKREIMMIPILGWSMWGARDIGVRRGMARSARRAMADCQQRLSQRVSVMIFPEGTRAGGDDLLPFKDGASRLAIDAGVPILPRRSRARGTPSPVTTGGSTPPARWRRSSSPSPSRESPTSTSSRTACGSGLRRRATSCDGSSRDRDRGRREQVAMSERRGRHGRRVAKATPRQVSMNGRDLRVASATSAEPRLQPRNTKYTAPTRQHAAQR